MSDARSTVGDASPHSDRLDAARDWLLRMKSQAIGLPAMNGYELGEQIRARHPQCRIIALTGHGQARDHELSSSAGFFAHLVKPVRIDVFLELLR